MTYRIPDTPSANSYLEEIADFWEIKSLQNYGIPVSSREIGKAIGIELDEILHDGLESEDDLLADDLESVFFELEKRERLLGNMYPFSLGKNSLLALPKSRYSLYSYMLLCTRFNMQAQKIFHNIDATLLFEYLCAAVAQNYFGDNSQSFVFGTAQKGGFQSKINSLIDKLGEGGRFINPDPSKVTKNDGGLDVVAWKEFADREPGKLIAFGQCKTGTSWRDSIDKLQPDLFCSNWLEQSPLMLPIRLAFVCDTRNRNRTYFSETRGFLFFNRFRILEYLDFASDRSAPYPLIPLTSWLDGAWTELGVDFGE